MSELSSSSPSAAEAVARQSRAFTYVKAEQMLRRRASLLSAARDQYLCTVPRAHLAIAQAVLHDYLESFFSLPHTEEYDSEDVFYAVEAFLYVPLVVLALLLLCRLIYWTARRLAYRQKVKATYERCLRRCSGYVRDEMALRQLRDGELRASRHRVHFFAALQLSVAFGVVLVLSSLTALTNATVQRFFRAWWDGLVRGPERASALSRVIFVSRSALPSVLPFRKGNGSAATAPVTSFSLDLSLARLSGPRRSAEGTKGKDDVGFATLFFGGLRTMENLYLLYWVGLTLVGLAVYLGKSATGSVQSVAELETPEGNPLLAKTGKELNELRREQKLRLTMHETFAEAARRAAIEGSVGHGGTERVVDDRASFQQLEAKAAERQPAKVKRWKVKRRKKKSLDAKVKPAAQ